MSGVKCTPKWVTDACTQLFGKLTATLCDRCGKPIIQDRETIWEEYDPYVVCGKQIMIAIILKRTLMRLEPASWSYRIVSTWHETGISADGLYMTMHECGKPLISQQKITTLFAKRSRASPADEFPQIHMVPTGGDPWAAIPAENTLF